jgi:hypothetical protein
MYVCAEAYFGLSNYNAQIFYGRTLLFPAISVVTIALMTFQQALIRARCSVFANIERVNNILTIQRAKLSFSLSRVYRLRA